MEMVGGINIANYGYRYKELVRDKYPRADSKFNYTTKEWEVWTCLRNGYLLARSDNVHRAWRNAFQMYILRKDRKTSHLWISPRCH